MSKHKPRIRRRGGTWVLDYGRVPREDGQPGTYQKRRAFKTKAEAEAERDSMGFETTNRNVRLMGLTDDQRADVLKALSLLDGAATLEVAVRHYLKHGRPVSGPKELADVAAEYLAAKERAGRRPATVKDAKVKVDRFVREIGKTHVHEVTTADIEAWLNAQGFTPASWESYRVAVRGFYVYCVKRGYAATNPANPIDRVEFDQAVPEVMDVGDVRKIMATAEKHYPDMVPHLAIGFFCGLRKAELEGLRWEHIDLEERIITVTPATAKKRRMRHVEIPDNALEWITPHWRSSGPVHYSRRHFRAIRDKAKVGWADNAMRHSFASYHIAHHQDPAKTSLLLGHQRPDVLFSNYRNIRTIGGSNVTAKLAAKYWRIKPEAIIDKVIRLAAE